MLDIFIDYVIKATAVLWFGGTVFTLFWFYKSYKKLIPIEKEMQKLNEEINGGAEKEYRKHPNPYINQSQYEKMMEIQKKDLKNQLAVLEMKRKFILEKLPLIGIFKK